MNSDKKMDDIIKESIIELFEEFKRNPEAFKDEKILTYKFYDIIINKNHHEYKFRWEFPTKAFYRRHTPNDTSKKHKYIDICFIKDDSDLVPYALEFKLKLNKMDIQSNENENEFNPSNFRVIDADFDELCYQINKIIHGYVIFFTFGKIINDSDRETAHIQNKRKFFDLNR